MEITLNKTNVREHKKSNGDKVWRTILMDPGNTCEKFFHYDCKDDTEKEILDKAKEATFTVHGFQTQYSDTIAVQGTLRINSGK